MKGKDKSGKTDIAKEGEKISRKKAIKKVGYAAFSAATMMLLLNDPARASHSPVLPPDWGDGDGWG
jgi:hypothetical protein